MTAAISARLPKEQADPLDNIVKETERPRSFIIQEAFEASMGDFADLQAALARFHDRTESIVTGKELRKSLGL